MNKNTEVSIILPNYNSYPFIKKTIKSIIYQSYKNWKLFLIDDCSDKKTQTFIKKFKNNKKIKIYWLKKNRGAGYCRNFALKKINSKYIAFIDSDDIWKKNKLKNQINFMKKNNYQFTDTNYETFGLGKRRTVLPPRKFTFLDFIHNTSIATSTMVVTNKVTKKIRFTNTKICEDYFYKCKILKRTKSAICLNQSLTKYQIRKSSMQSNYLKNFYWIWKINKKYNKLNFFRNLTSLFFISFNSIKKYGLKN